MKEYLEIWDWEKAKPTGKKISRKDIIAKLGKLPKVKHHCSILAADGLKLAIENYEKEKGLNKKIKIK